MNYLILKDKNMFMFSKVFLHEDIDKSSIDEKISYLITVIDHLTLMYLSHVAIALSDYDKAIFKLVTKLLKTKHNEIKELLGDSLQISSVIEGNLKETIKVRDIKYDINYNDFIRKYISLVDIHCFKDNLEPSVNTKLTLISFIEKVSKLIAYDFVYFYFKRNTDIVIPKRLFYIIEQEYKYAFNNMLMFFKHDDELKIHFESVLSQ